MKKIIKAIILDQDNTLYVNKEMRGQYREKFKKFVLKETDVNVENFDEWLKENLKKFAYNWYDILDYLKINPEKFGKEVIESLDVENFLSKDCLLIDCLENLQLPIYIVTGSTPDFSERVRNTLGIEHLIKKSYIVNYASEDYSIVSARKIDYYNEILRQENLKPNEICIFGDSFTFDLKDADESGFHTVLVGSHREYPNRIDTIYDIKDIIEKITAI